MPKGLGGRAEATGQDLIAAKDVDAIIVTSIGSTHEEFVLAAIAAGKPVFCEKPLATTAAACKRILDAEVTLGKRLVQVGFMRRYDAGYRLLKELVTKGGIGAPLIAHCAHRNPAVGDDYTTDMAITDTVIHEIDTMRWLLDDEYVSAQILYPKKTSKASKHLADPQIVLLETATGIRIDVEVFVNATYGYDIQCELVGETGVARLPEPSNVLMRSEAKLSVEILTDWKKRFIASYDVELQEWIHSVAANKIGRSVVLGRLCRCGDGRCLYRSAEERQNCGDQTGYPSRPLPTRLTLYHLDVRKKRVIKRQNTLDVDVRKKWLLMSH